MPTYDYHCKRCNQHFEIFHSINERRRKCPNCKSNRLERQIGSGAAIIFKGNGFYETDYKRKPVKDKEKKTSETTATPSKNTSTPQKNKDTAAKKKTHNSRNPSRSV